MIMFLFAISISILLMGCSGIGKESNDDDSLTDSFKETQKIEVISSDGDVITTISSDKDIKKFVKTLKIDEWESADIPSEVAKGKTFVMYRKDTVKLGEVSKQDSKLNKIATMTTYKDIPYIKLNLKSFAFSFKIPKEVSEYLNEDIGGESQ